MFGNVIFIIHLCKKGKLLLYDVNVLRKLKLKIYVVINMLLKINSFVSNFVNIIVSNRENTLSYLYFLACAEAKEYKHNIFVPYTQTYMQRASFPTEYMLTKRVFSSKPCRFYVV